MGNKGVARREKGGPARQSGVLLSYMQSRNWWWISVVMCRIAILSNWGGRVHLYSRDFKARGSKRNIADGVNA